MRKLFLIVNLLFLVCLTACNPTSEPAEVAQEPTQPSPSATPLPTDTAVPEPTVIPTETPTATPIPEPTVSPEELSAQFFTAITENDLAAVSELITEGIDPNLKNNASQPALILAQNQDDPMPIIDLLVEAGADIEVTDRLGTTPLIRAAADKNDKVALVSYFLEKGAAVDATTSGGATALILAVQNNNTAVVEYLIAAGADVNHQDDSQYQLRPIHWAARKGYLDSLKLLLDAGVDIDSVEGTKSSAIFWAAYQGHEAVVEHLLSAGADLTLRDNVGETVLYWAKYQGEDEIAQMIIDAGGTE